MEDKLELLERIKSALTNRLRVNSELGLSETENRLDSKLFGLYGELLAEIRTGGQRADQVNQASYDLETSQGITIQVKARAIYESNNDGIHIDFKSLDFDYLFLLVVNESLEHLAEIYLSKESLKELCHLEKSGKYRLRNIRTRYTEYTQRNSDFFTN